MLQQLEAGEENELFCNITIRVKAGETFAWVLSLILPPKKSDFQTNC